MVGVWLACKPTYFYLKYLCYQQNESVRRIRSDWPKSHRRNGTRDEHKHLDRIYEKQICSYGTFDFFAVLLKMQFSVRTVFQGERVLNIFNMVISGIKTPNV